MAGELETYFVRSGVDEIIPMISFDKILFPVDFSDRCRIAARYVESVAANFGSKLILLHVMDVLDPAVDINAGGMMFETQVEERALALRKVLDPYLEDELKPLKVERRLEIGEPARVIVEMAHNEDVDLIMMPTHGYGGFRRFILGSVTAKVLHDAGCPVWTGAHMQEPPLPGAIRMDHISCAVDLGPENEAPLKTAASLAEEYVADLTVIHIVPSADAGPARFADVDLRGYLIKDARERLQAACANLQIKAQIRVEAGSSIAAMVSAAATQHGAGLLVIGRSQHHGLGRLRTHSYSIIREAQCPVLSI